MNRRRVATRGAVTAGAVLGLLLASAPVKALPLAGDQTIVLLTSFSLLSGAGISVDGIEDARTGLDLDERFEALFPITGGDLTGLAGTIEHDGSGLSLSGSAGTVSLENDTVVIGAIPAGRENWLVYGSPMGLRQMMVADEFFDGSIGSLQRFYAQAWTLAQFLKRVGFSDFRVNAQDDDEAYAMRDAADLVRVALRDAGFAPR